MKVGMTLNKETKPNQTKEIYSEVYFHVSEENQHDYLQIALLGTFSLPESQSFPIPVCSDKLMFSLFVNINETKICCSSDTTHFSVNFTKFSFLSKKGFNDKFLFKLYKH